MKVKILLNPMTGDSSFHSRGRVAFKYLPGNPTKYDFTWKGYVLKAIIPSLLSFTTICLLLLN